MTLNPAQIKATQNELAQNFALSGLTKEQVCTELNISSSKCDHVMNLNQQALEDPWIMKNFLIEKVKAAGKQPVPFTALSGDYHRHWFLNSKIIESGQMTAGDR